MINDNKKRKARNALISLVIAGILCMSLAGSILAGEPGSAMGGKSAQISVLNLFDENGQIVTDETGRIDLEFAVRSEAVGIKAVNFTITSDGQSGQEYVTLQSTDADGTLIQNDPGSWVIQAANADTITALVRQTETYALQTLTVELGFTDNNGDYYSEQYYGVVVPQVVEAETESVEEVAVEAEIEVAGEEAENGATAEGETEAAGEMEATAEAESEAAGEAEAVTEVDSEITAEAVGEVTAEAEIETEDAIEATASTETDVAEEVETTAEAEYVDETAMQEESTEENESAWENEVKEESESESELETVTEAETESESVAELETNHELTSQEESSTEEQSAEVETATDMATEVVADPDSELETESVTEVGLTAESDLAEEAATEATDNMETTAAPDTETNSQLAEPEHSVLEDTAELTDDVNQEEISLAAEPETTIAIESESVSESELETTLIVEQETSDEIETTPVAETETPAAESETTTALEPETTSAAEPEISSAEQETTLAEESETTTAFEPETTSAAEPETTTIAEPETESNIQYVYVPQYVYKPSASTYSGTYSTASSTRTQSTSSQNKSSSTNSQPSSSGTDTALTKEAESEAAELASEAAALEESAKESESETQHVNTEGSTYDLSALESVNGKSLKETGTIVVCEQNQDKLVEDSIKITVSKDDETYELEKGTDYDVMLTGNSENKKIYQYTINADTFKDDGRYKMFIYSEDEAGNSNSNEIKGSSIEFSVDNTDPLIIDCSDASTVNDTSSGEMIIKDNIQLDEVDIYVDDQKVDYAVDGETYSFSIPESDTAANVKVVAKDAAGNVYERTFEGYKAAGKATVKSESNASWIIGVVLFLAAAAILVLRIRRKKRRASAR